MKNQIMDIGLWILENVLRCCRKADDDGTFSLLILMEKYIRLK